MRIAEGRAHGVLAYSDGRVVGWVNAGPVSDLDALQGGGRAFGPDQGAIVCYVVDPRHRRRGVGTRLLEEACAMLRDLGLASVDAWPLRRVTADDRLPTSALVYHGTRSMYERAGFEVVEDDPESPFLQVRRRLGP